jgi:hypothetical protein
MVDVIVSKTTTAADTAMVRMVMSSMCAMRRGGKNELHSSVIQRSILVRRRRIYQTIPKSAVDCVANGQCTIGQYDYLGGGGGGS